MWGSNPERARYYLVARRMFVSEHAVFEVLSPWAEADPIPLFGITPRLDRLADKKIGLFYNYKRASALMLQAVDEQLKKQFPSIATSFYRFSGANIPEIETSNAEKFKEWVQGVDGVVLAVGD